MVAPTAGVAIVAKLDKVDGTVVFARPRVLDDLVLMRINLNECTGTDQRSERVVLGPDVPIKYVPYASVLHQEQRHFTQTLKHSMHEIRLFQKNFVLQFQRSRHNRLCSRDSSAPEVRVRQRDQALFFVQVADIKPEQGQDLIDIAFVDKAQAVELL